MKTARNSNVTMTALSSLPPSLKLVGKQTERICIPFKVSKVLPLGRCQLALQGHSFSLGKKGGNSSFSRMSERRISQVVCQAGGRNYGAYFGEVAALQFRVAGNENFRYIVA